MVSHLSSLYTSVSIAPQPIPVCARLAAAGQSQLKGLTLYTLVPVSIKRQPFHILYRDSHYKDKKVAALSYFYNGDSYTEYTTMLYWEEPQEAPFINMDLLRYALVITPIV